MLDDVGVTLLGTNSSPLKIDRLTQKEMNHLNQPPFFRGELSVLGRVWGYREGGF